MKKIADLVQKFWEFFYISDSMSSADWLGWIFTLISGIIVLWYIQVRQTQISRNNLIYEIERHICILYSSNFARVIRKRGKKIKKVCVRYVLHDDSSWNSYQSNNRKEIDGQRFVMIRHCDSDGNTKYFEEYISTQALHEIVIVFHELEKLHKHHILKPYDLVDMFHELLPWGVSGRLEFIADYLGSGDADVIGYLMLHLVLACNKYLGKDSVDMFKSYYLKNQRIHCHIVHSSRLRMCDLFKVWRFKRLMYD